MERVPEAHQMELLVLLILVKMVASRKMAQQVVLGPRVRQLMVPQDHTALVGAAVLVVPPPLPQMAVLVEMVLNGIRRMVLVAAGVAAAALFSSQMALAAMVACMAAAMG